MSTGDEIERLRREIAQADEETAPMRLRLAVLTAQGTHTNGVRDPENPCSAFRLGPLHGGEGRCETDGHYACDECTERATCPGCKRRPTQCECPEVCEVWP